MNVHTRDKGSPPASTPFASDRTWPKSMGIAEERLRDRQRHLREQLQQRVVPGDMFDWQTPGFTVPGRFAAMATRYPDHVAVIDDSVSLTYRQLDEASNRVANALLNLPDASDIVAIVASPTAEAVILLLGTLKAGKAFVGFDDVFSLERYEQIIADAGSHTIIYDSGHVDLAAQLNQPDRQLLEAVLLANASADPVHLMIDPHAPAVLNYSSGSTGRPKGVLGSHHSMLAHAAQVATLCHLNPTDRMVNFLALAWAGSYWGLFGPLFFGATVVTYDARLLTSEELVDRLIRDDVTVIMGSTIVRLPAAAEENRTVPSVRLVCLGGDTVYRRHVETSRRLFPNALVDVGLGTSEAARVAEWLIGADDPLEELVMPVGLPGPGITLRLINDEGHEVERGEIGEITVQSSYLVPGYWKRPDLTSEQFRRDEKYGPDPVYFTGDLGMIGPDGALRHMGRKDFQVKIRGYQVFSNDIEGLLESQPGVKQACVVKFDSTDGHESLVAYLAIDEALAPLTEDLQAVLSARLPSYSVPHQFVYLAALPLTPTMKIDRNRLPVPGNARPALQALYRAPATPVESRLVVIWQDVLGLTQVGVDDPFLSLGGDSIRAAQVVNRVLTEFELSIPIATLLSHATVAAMAIQIVEALADRFEPDAGPSVG